jgi:murein DD-endopeptidase MepM/ murein hydrolase activator NlpD
MAKKVSIGTIAIVAGFSAVVTGCGLEKQESTTAQPAPAKQSALAQPAQLPDAGHQVSAQRYVFPVQTCRVNYGPAHHDYPATDVFTDRGCAFVAVTDGQVDEVTSVDRWDPHTDLGADRGGRSVSILGTDGVRYYGSHLESIAEGTSPGKLVHAGDLLGRIDNSGDAHNTPTHVHFGISWPTRPEVWWVRRGEISPFPYLKSWQSGGSRSPAEAVADTRRTLGDEPPCRVEC